MKDRLEVADKLAIHELLSRAAYALDEREIDLLESCFAPDAQLTMRIASGDLIGPFDGRVGIMQLMTDSMAAQTDKRRHVISNIFFESESEEAVSVMSNLTLLATEHGEINVLSAGLYRDHVVQQGGRWQLHRRHIELDRPY